MYKKALETLAKCRRRTAEASNWIEYAEHAVATLSARSSELLTHHRAKHKWKRCQILQRHLSRTADYLFDRKSLRECRAMPSTMVLSDAQRTRLVSELRMKRQGKRENPKQHVVFFGDGTFGHQKGGAAIPKKKLLHQLATRGCTVLLDECNTSKMCPSGTKLANDTTICTTDNETVRVRVHQTTGGDPCGILALRRDRDELATINMGLAVLRALRHLSWPSHLLRR